MESRCENITITVGKNLTECISLQPMVPRMLDFLNRQINQRLSLGYDIGKGYVVGEEEVSKYINHMVDHKQILESLKRLSEESR